MSKITQAQIDSESHTVARSVCLQCFGVSLPEFYEMRRGKTARVPTDSELVEVFVTPPERNFDNRTACDWHADAMEKFRKDLLAALEAIP